MKTLIVGFLLTISLGLTFGQNATSPAQSQPLKLNQPIEQQIKAGETQEFQIALQAGEFIHVEAQQKGVDVVVRLYAPDGQLILERDSPNGTEGPESLSYLANATGTYKLTVNVWERATVKQGGYAMELKAMRQPTPKDRKRITAEVLFREAVVLGDQAQALRNKAKAEEAEKVSEQSQAKYKESLTLWRELEAKYWEALTLVATGSIENNERAAKIYEEMGDKKRAQDIWLSIGKSYERSKKWEQARESFAKALNLAKERKNADSIEVAHKNLTIAKVYVLVEEGQRLSNAGRRLEAIATLDKAFEEIETTNGEAKQEKEIFENLGQLFLDLSEFIKAKESYQKAFQIAREARDLNGIIANSRNLERVSKRLKPKGINAELVVQTGHTRVVTFAIAPDGKTLASGNEDLPMVKTQDKVGITDQSIKLWDVASGTELRTFSGHTDSVWTLAFAPDGKTLASGSSDQTIKLWDVASGTELRTFSGHTKAVTSIALTPDGKTLASASMDKTIKLWDIASGAELRTFSGHREEVNFVAIAPDGKTAVSLSGNQTIKLWDIASGAELRTFSGHTKAVTSIALTPDGKTLASASMDKTIKLWDIASGAELRTFSGHTDSVWTIALAPDGKTLASASMDKTIKLWDITSSAEPRTLDYPGYYISKIAFTPDGKALAIGNMEEGITFLEITSSAELRTFSGHKNYISSVVFAPDGKTLAVGAEHKTRIWDIALGIELHTLSGISPLAFSPDSKTLVGWRLGMIIVSKGFEYNLKLWDVVSGKELPSPNPSPSWVRDPLNLKMVNGKPILAVPDGGQINFIAYDTGEKRCSLIFLDQRDWVVVTPDGLFDASPGAMRLMHFVISGIEEGYAVVALDQMKDRYYQPNLLAKMLGFDNTPIKEIPPFTGEKLFPKLEYKLQEKEQTKLDINLHNRGGGIGEVAVLVNGKTFINDVRPRGFNPNAKDAAFTVDLKNAPFLPGASNQVEVVARNAEGWLTSPRGVKAMYTPAAAAAKPDAELWAIVGGVSDYEGTQLDLNFAAKDAEDFANAIKLGGYRLFGANRVHLQTLTTNNKDPKLLPTKENFRRVFTEFQKAKPNDVLLVYLSGHGVAFRVNGDKVIYNYLTQSATNGDVKDSDVRGKVAITSDELMEWIRLIPTNKNVLLFDTCAAGAFADNLNLALKKDEAGEHLDNQKIAMNDLKYRMGFHILMGAAADKPSYETSQFNQGLLTYALLEGIKFGAVNDRKIVNVSELFQYARSRVPKLAESIGNVNVQTPQIAAPQGETFPLLQMSNDDSEAIRLEKERPIIMRPRLVNTDDFDDVELEKTLIRQLKAASQPVKRGDASRHSPLVFLETWELPSAIKPSGSYKYDGEQVTVNLKLLRDKQMVGTLTVVGRKKDLPGLVEKIIAELVVAIGKLTKTISK